MQKELKERKQCSYKPSSVPIPSETIRAPVIYLVPESPLGSSTLPSTVARRQSDEPPSICGLHELTAPRWHSLAITRQLVVSYTTFSPLPDTKPRRMLKAPSLRNKFRAVVFFYRHLLSPIASIFGSGMPYAARTFLSHPPVENASDKPEHCFRNAKIAKKFDLTANFSAFLNSFRFLGMILLLSHPERLTFQSSFSLIPFTSVCISKSFNFIYKTIIFQKSSK